MIFFSHDHKMSKVKFEPSPFLPHSKALINHPTTILCNTNNVNAKNMNTHVSILIMIMKLNFDSLVPNR
jgi:hypothetical protein